MDTQCMHSMDTQCMNSMDTQCMNSMDTQCMNSMDRVMSAHMHSITIPHLHSMHSMDGLSMGELMGASRALGLGGGWLPSCTCMLPSMHAAHAVGCAATCLQPQLSRKPVRSVTALNPSCCSAL
jgi:hypothetical protein